MRRGDNSCHGLHVAVDWRHKENSEEGTKYRRRVFAVRNSMQVEEGHLAPSCNIPQQTFPNFNNKGRKCVSTKETYIQSHKHIIDCIPP